MNEFPRMLYKAGGVEEIHGGKFATLIVQDADELDAALAGGWYMTTPEARDAARMQAHIEMVKESGFVPGDGEGVQTDNAAPTRAELEQKATELSLEFSPRIGDAKLAERIEAALADKA